MSRYKGAVITNGTTLFGGDAGSKECEIRKDVFGRVEKIVMLPSDMFSNTGINTYVWIFGESKHITLIDAHESYTKMKRSVGNMRHTLENDDISRIVNGDIPSKTFDKEHFFYNKVWVTLDVPKDSHYPQKDTEITPYSATGNEGAIRDFLERYVKPFHDYKITKVITGVEVNFNKEFYVPEEIGRVNDIAKEILELEEEGHRLVMDLLSEFV